jgi:hypothetical protein
MQQRSTRWVRATSSEKRGPQMPEQSRSRRPNKTAHPPLNADCALVLIPEAKKRKGVGAGTKHKAVSLGLGRSNTKTEKRRGLVEAWELGVGRGRARARARANYWMSGRRAHEGDKAGGHTKAIRQEGTRRR